MVVNGGGSARLILKGPLLQARKDAKMILMRFSALPQAATMASPFRTVAKQNRHLSAHGSQLWRPIGIV